ncbi:MAG TPA: HEAT repeat domain-containing protein [Vicinamibacterales bacterium]|nr:HEAT repeat domain-containing protein [Vicinamibacterales bacterium]
MPDTTTTALDPESTARLTDFARTCKAAARAVSLYPGGHPAIVTTLGRLAQITTALTESGPFTLQVRPGTLQIDEAAPVKPDAAVAELAELLRRQLIGRLTFNSGADAESWRTLLMLLARPPEEVRADGGIAHLWATAGGPSVEIQEIDYAEVLRERQGDAAALDRIIAAALAGPQAELDDSAMRTLLEIVGDPARLEELIARLQADTADQGVDVRMAAFLSLLRNLTEYVGRTQPDRLEGVLRQMSQAAGRLTADGMLDLLARRTKPEAMAGSINVVSAVIDRMSDSSVAQFVSSAVISERGASERLAQAFQALVPEYDRQRQLLALAEADVEASPLGQDESFAELWTRVETMLTSYSDANFVSDAYGRELSNARTRATEVEATNDDPPERIAAWVGTVSDGALRTLDQQLLVDLLSLEQEPERWRDIAETAISHAEDLVRVGYFDAAWFLAEQVASESAKVADRQPYASAVLDRFGRGPMMKQVARHLRNAGDEEYERFARLCRAIGPAVIAPLAEVLSSEQDARARRRLRDVLVGFGAAGRESVQQLMNAPNWEVRRTAAYLLREFGGTEGLRELQPLLTDNEPLVQREAIQALVLNGSDAAADILMAALTATTGRPRQSLMTELATMRDERAGPLFCYLLRHLDRKAFPAVYLGAIEALGAFGGPDAVEALKEALQHGELWAPLRTRRTRAAAARALRKIGTTAAVETLREASSRGPRGVRSAARAELARLG